MRIALYYLLRSCCWRDWRSAGWRVPIAGFNGASRADCACLAAARTAVGFRTAVVKRGDLSGLSRAGRSSPRKSWTWTRKSSAASRAWASILPIRTKRRRSTAVRWCRKGPCWRRSTTPFTGARWTMPEATLTRSGRSGQRRRSSTRRRDGGGPKALPSKAIAESDYDMAVANYRAALAGRGRRQGRGQAERSRVPRGEDQSRIHRDPRPVQGSSSTAR